MPPTDIVLTPLVIGRIKAYLTSDESPNLIINGHSLIMILKLKYIYYLE